MPDATKTPRHWRNSRMLEDSRTSARPRRCRCLGCRREFDSPDVLSVRFCDRCRNSQERPNVRVYRDPAWRH